MRERHEEERLSAFLDDELGDEAALRITRHLTDCESCLAELEALRATRDALRGLPEVEPAAAVATTALVTATGHRGRRTTTAAAILLAALATLVGGAVLAERTDGDTVPPVDDFVVDHVVRTGGGPVLTPVDLRAGR